MTDFTKGSVANLGAVQPTKVGFVIAKEGIVRAVRKDIYNFDNIESNPEIAKSYLGTPVISNIIFGDLKETANNVYLDIDGTQKTFEPLQINDVIIEVTQTKTRVKTALQGRRGTIKQYVCDGDFLITATGRITPNNKNNQNIYPETDVNKLIKICSIPDSIAVISGHLQRFGIDNIVIDEYRIPEQVGKSCEQYFELTMSSDKEIDLENVT